MGWSRSNAAKGVGYGFARRVIYELFECSIPPKLIILSALGFAIGNLGVLRFNFRVSLAEDDGVVGCHEVDRRSVEIL